MEHAPTIGGSAHFAAAVYQKLQGYAVEELTLALHKLCISQFSHVTSPTCEITPDFLNLISTPPPFELRPEI